MGGKEKILETEHRHARSIIDRISREYLFSTDIVSTLALAAGVDRKRVLVDELKVTIKRLEEGI